MYRETLTLKRTSPFLTAYLLSASYVLPLLMLHVYSLFTRIMHILTCEILTFNLGFESNVLPVSLRSSHVEAALGLQQCMLALKDMEVCAKPVSVLLKYSS
jgi:hypothetical protein